MPSPAKLSIFPVKLCAPRTLSCSCPKPCLLVAPLRNGSLALRPITMDARESETVIRGTLLRYTPNSFQVNRFLGRVGHPP
jgi:hypothetical protein